MQTLILRPVHAGQPLNMSYYCQEKKDTYSILENGSEFVGSLSAVKDQRTEMELSFSTVAIRRIQFDPEQSMNRDTILAKAILKHPFVFDLTAKDDKQHQNFIRKYFYAEIEDKVLDRDYDKSLSVFKSLYQFWTLKKEDWMNVAFALNIDVKDVEPRKLAVLLGDPVTGAVIKNSEKFLTYLKEKAKNSVSIEVNKARALGLLGEGGNGKPYIFNGTPIANTIDEAVLYFTNKASQFDWLKSELGKKDVSFRDYTVALAKMEEPAIATLESGEEDEMAELKAEIVQKDVAIDALNNRLDELSASLNATKEEQKPAIGSGASGVTPAPVATSVASPVNRGTMVVGKNGPKPVTSGK